MAAASFNSSDRASWYCGKLSRQDTQKRLQGKTHGTFLVRDSNTCIGDYVLSVSENSKVSHYIINQVNGRLKIGEQDFGDLPELLEFYKVHYLDTTTLIQPSIAEQEEQQSVVDGPSQNGGVQNLQKELNENVVALFDFKSDDGEDLPFVKGEVLEIIGKPEENWWTARNTKGQTGQIPVPYVKQFVPNPSNRKSMPAYQQPGLAQLNRHSMPDVTKTAVYARAKMKRVPNAYDPSSLAFEVGDMILVTKMNKNGQWEGRVGNRSGTFPFTHVDLIDNTGN
ncbi:crk-like protein [Styela clava]|uniref:crk-like protein n=1 Tax=Styela clava TaxID=7725 RepID=UPI001939AD97|nr:crk-like protein [Styela clava]